MAQVNLNVGSGKTMIIYYLLIVIYIRITTFENDSTDRTDSMNRFLHDGGLIFFAFTLFLLLNSVFHTLSNNRY